MSERAAYSLDGEDVSRDAFYAAACDPRRSVVVEACAGAGKTWMLVSRILRALLDGAQPHEILAITFTRKAAGEMRARLNQWLSEFSAQRCSDADRVAHLRARGLDAAQARALAPALGTLDERLLRSGRPVEIRTFHAWFSQLLRAAPLELLGELGLQADMEIVEDIAEHKGEIYRRFHAAVLAEEKLSADYHAMVRERGRSQLRRWLDNAWDKRVEIELADAAGTLASSVPPAHRLWPELEGLAHPAQRMRFPVMQSMLARAALALGEQKGLSRKHGALLEEALEVEDDARRFAAARAALFTRAGEARKNVDAPGLPEVLDLLDDIHRHCAQQAAHEEHLRMTRLSRALLKEVAAYKRLRGLADMADLERCALALLRDATLSGWVQERLDARIRHVLIDEFQDTSPLQWHALHAWLSAYAGAGGGLSGQRPPAIFIVGDPKQSIYRFRRAEPRVFDAAGDFVAEALAGHRLACDHTRRNAPEVLAVLNPVFEAAQRAGEFTGFRVHTTECRAAPGAGLRVLPRIPRPPADAPVDSSVLEWRDSLRVARHDPEEALREPEARQVAQAVRQLLGEGIAPGDIHLLCRKRESLRLVADELAALHLPFAAAEDFSLLDAPEARDLLAVLDVLASPQHKLSLAHALRSPLFDAGDADLVALAQAAAPHGDWWRALMSLDTPSLPLQRAAQLLARWQAAAQGLPPHDLIDQIVAEGELRERVAAAVPAERRTAALGAVDAVIAQALMLDGARYATPYNFVRALKRRAIKVAAPAQPDAVQLLTVHGAKGLEARVVFVLDSDPEPKSTETATLLVDWPVESGHPLCCAFVYAESQCPPSLEATLQREFAAREREELNGLYVAMTRAKERLVFSSTEPYRPAGGPSWWARVQAHAMPWSVADAPAAPASAIESVWLRVLPHWRAPDVTLSTPAAAADDAASRLGQAVHRVLEWAAAPTRPVAAGLDALAHAAAQEFDVDSREVVRLAGAIWHSPACARFFGGKGLRWAGNEVPVSDAGTYLRIDRLVELDEAGERTWWVLDYKLHHAPQALAPYREQLRRYRAAVGALQPGVTVRCAFITGAGDVVEVE
jgi:ATP-dependent helicase/nuclease subunit A